MRVERRRPAARPVSHVVRSEDLDEAAPEGAHKDRGDGQRDRQRRQGQMPDRVEAAGPRPRDREEPEPDPEKERQNDREPERRQAERRREHEADRLVDDAATPDRRDRGERDGEGEGEEGRIADQQKRERDPGPGEQRDVRLVEERDAEVPANRVTEVVQVLLPQWKVEAELVADASHQLGRCSAAEDRNRRVAGNEPDEQEDDHAHAEEDRHDLEQPPGEVADHSAPTPPSIVSADPVTNRASSDAR